MMVLPESPRWLASKDRWEECERVLVLVHGHGDPNSPWVAREFREIKEWLEIERQSKQISYVRLTRMPWERDFQRLMFCVVDS